MRASTFKITCRALPPEIRIAPCPGIVCRSPRIPRAKLPGAEGAQTGESSLEEFGFRRSSSARRRESPGLSGAVRTRRGADERETPGPAARGRGSDLLELSP
jgi:hypothetical protein